MMFLFDAEVTGVFSRKFKYLTIKKTSNQQIFDFKFMSRSHI